MRSFGLLTALFLIGCVRDSNGQELSGGEPRRSTIFVSKSEVLQPNNNLDECMKAKPSEVDILKLIEHSKLVDGREWHDNHVYPPCRFVGQIKYMGEVKSYAYYPTGYLTLEGLDGWLMCYECTVNSNLVVFDDLRSK